MIWMLGVPIERRDSVSNIVNEAFKEKLSKLVLFKNPLSMIIIFHMLRIIMGITKKIVGYNIFV